MRAIVQTRFGGPDALELVDRDQPVPGADEVLVRVHAAGLDAGVSHILEGRPWPVRLALPVRHPRVLGLDVAGTVAAVGSEVTSLAVGDAVYGTARGLAGAGSLAEYALAKADLLAPKPAMLSFEEAAAVPVSATTALCAMRAARVGAGQRVLVLGAGGGVGHFAVQVATALGARVTGVCSTAKLNLVRSLGAETVVDYTAEDPLAAPKPYDAIIDTGGHRRLSALRRALTPRGALVIVGSEPERAPLDGLGRGMLAALLSPFTRQRLVMLVVGDGREPLLELTRLIESGRLRPVIDRVFPLEETADAMRHLGRGHGTGKTVVRVLPSD